MTASHQPAVPSKSASRRALLAGALGGLGAWAAGAIGRASPVRAEGEAIVVGGEYTTAQSVTSLKNEFNNAVVFKSESASAGTAVWGISNSGYGVYSSSTSGVGVRGTSTSSIGVWGTSNSNYGVRGESASGIGIRGTGGIGVEGQSNDQFAWGVGGYNSAPGGIGVWGQASGGLGRGVSGFSAAGRGVYGESTSGYAGFFHGKVFTDKFYELVEVPSAPAPAANRARLFIRDSGGKTQLCVRFHTGPIRVLATEA